MAVVNIPLRFLSLVVISAVGALGHVKLTFPPARYPPLDFLDNARTSPPCGIPKPPQDLGLRTSLLSGSTFNVTWSLAYPHQGGFRIEILDSKDQVQYVLTPEQQQYTGLNDPTAQSYQVKLPEDVECENCALRLLRQAKEWSENYQFWSCADVNIVKDVVERCNDHGKFVNGQCQCERLYSGDRCQYKDECWTDQDCGSRVNGKCQDLEVFSYPRRVCYCEPGWFGPGCQQISPLKNTVFDTALYQYRSFGEDENKLYWRIMPESNEIEVVLQYRSRTWIALGWKPKNLSPQCSNLNNLIGLLYGTAKSSSADKANNGHPAIIPVAEPNPNKTEVNHPETNNSRIWRPQGGGISGFAEEITLSAEEFFKQHPAGNDTDEEVTEFSANSGSIELPVFPLNSGSKNKTNKSLATNESIDTSSEIRPPDVAAGVTYDIPISHAPVEILPETGVTVGTGPYPSGGIKPSAEIESDVVGDLCYGEWRWPPNCRDCDYKVSWTYIDEIDEIEFSIETKTPENSWTGIGFSSNGNWADSDIMVVKSLGDKLSAQDMYAVSNNPVPKVDPQQNLILPQIIGTHINGVLRAAFSRPRRTADTEHDVQFTDANCFYFLFPVQGGSVDNQGRLGELHDLPKISPHPVCIKSCNPQGGPVQIQRSCEREFKFPPGCQQSACDYLASWSFDEKSESVSFNVSSKELGRWTGIGFSRNGNMTNSDIVLGWVYENGTYITDRFAYGKQQPAIDKIQDIQDVRGRIVDDVQTLSFSRKLVTKDDKEDLSLKDCLYFLFPVGGGRVLARSAGDLQDKATPVGFHDLYIPKISKTPICICSDDGVPVSGANITVIKRSKRANATPKPEDEYEYYDDNTTVPNALANSTSIVLTPASTLTTTFKETAAGIIDLTAETTGLAAETQSRAAETTGRASETQSHAAATTVNAAESTGRATATINATSNVPVPEPSPEPSPTPEVSAKPEPAPKASKDGIAKASPEPEPEPTGKPEPHSHAEPTPEGEPKGSILHPMDCSDIIVGSTIGSLSRVEDYYTINRATPLVDEVYGGVQSLTAATGFEENGITTVMFRRKLLSQDLADHNITDGEMTVIWAKGQEAGHYSHTPNSGLEVGANKQQPQFYGSDVLAYHGHKNRGVLSLNFFEKPAAKNTAVCRGEQVYPPGCQGYICLYNITWVSTGDNVEFVMDVKMSTNRWTGVGFSKDGAMAKSDAVIVQVNPSGPVEITDRYIPTYSKPLIDKVQNIFNVDAQYLNGRVKARFSRALATDDADQDLNLTDCIFFLYPFEGGPVSNNEVLKHAETPARSERICLNKCGKEQFKDKGPEAIPVSQYSKKYLLILKILNEKWSDALLDSNSDEFVGLSNKVVSAVNNVLSTKFKGYQKADVLRFKPGSVIADVQVTAAGLNEQDILDTVASSSEVQSLRIDPNSVQVREIQEHPTPDEIRNYVIIAVACFLVVVASVFAVCMLMRTRKRRSKDLKANRLLVPFSHYAYYVPSSGTYPPSYHYPSPTGATMEKKPQKFDNLGYHPDYPQHGMQRTQPREDKRQDVEGSPQSGATGRSGETTTYNDWYNKVNAGQTAATGASAQSPQYSTSDGGGRKHHQQQQRKGEMLPPPQAAAYYGPDPRLAYVQSGGEPYSVMPAPYVQYPNEPYGYYTLNGNSRVLPRGGYYAPY